MTEQARLRRHAAGRGRGALSIDGRHRWQIGTVATLAGLGLAAALAANTTVAAEAPVENGASESIFIVQLILLLFVGRLLGEVMELVKLPAIIGQLLAGIVLGPSVFGAVWPSMHGSIFPDNAQQKSMIDAVGQLGVLMILTMTGMETDLRLVRRIGRAAIVVSIAGVALPFTCGFILGELLPDSLLPDPSQRLVTSLFIGTMLSISSVKIVAIVVRELNFLRRDIGQIIVASAVIEDTIGWILIAVILGLASRGTLDVGSLAHSTVGTAAFLIASLTVGRRLVSLLIRWSNDHLKGEFVVVTTVLLIMGSMALITHWIGVHTVLGAFVAGILIGESPILVRAIDEQLRGVITALFMPVFFGLSGLSADLSILVEPRLLLLTLALVLVASIGKFSGAFVGGRVGGLTTRESLALGCAMNARGSTEVIVATIGLAMGVLSRDMFTMVLTMALITTTAMPPMLRAALLRLPMRPAEQTRLRQEAMDREGFVGNLERMLVAVDESANGRFASELAGFVAGACKLPTTVLHLAPDGTSRDRDEGSPARARAAAIEQTLADAAAASAARTRARDGETDARHPEISVRSGSEDPPQAVAEEAKKGFDLLWIGLAETHSKGGFDDAAAKIAESFDNALAIVVGRGLHLTPRANARFSILVPVNGSPYARNAAELAFVLAAATGSAVTAIYVSEARRGRRARRVPRVRRGENAIMADIRTLAERHAVRARSLVKAGPSASDVILGELKRSDFDLVVIGGSRRAGEELFFGNTVAAILENAAQSVLVVADRRTPRPRMRPESGSA